MDEKFRGEIESLMRRYENAPLEVINGELQKLADRNNNTGRADFDGLSPEQMRGLLYAGCNENMIKTKDDRGLDIPLIRQVVYYLNLIKAEGQVKLTGAGYLPPSMVKEIYSKKFLSDEIIELGIKKITSEADIFPVRLTVILCQAAGLTKKRNKTISLTGSGIKKLEKGNLLPVILSAFAGKCNWAYFDRYPDEDIGQIGAYFSIYLLAKYGDQKREAEFYANKYFRAFFKDLVGINTNEHHIYTVRTFMRFLDLFGFLEKSEENRLIFHSVQKSGLFDRYIEIVP